MKFLAAFPALAALSLRKPLPVRASRRRALRALTQAGSQAVPQAAARVGNAPVDADGTPAACGWFDSSWALQAGLQITEHASTDRVVNDLPLDWWLAWHAGAQRGGGVVAAAAAAACAAR